MKKVAVLTSGGDAPGMNAAILGVVKYGQAHDIEVYGINYGYKGLLNNEVKKLNLGDVEDTIHRGGTFLHTARSEYFQTKKGQEEAKSILDKYEIESLIIIGGNGSLEGAKKLSNLGMPTVVVPATIDNDIAGTDYAIGFDTAVNTVTQLIDSIKEAISSIGRTIIIEVMGRDAGYIALWAGICTEAESIIIPEDDLNLEKVIQRIEQNQARGKKHNIIVVAEGAYSGEDLKRKLESRTDLEIRTLVLGYLQRGGAPTAYDRMIAGQMGVKALELVENNFYNYMVTVKNGKISEIQYADIDRNEVANDLFNGNESISVLRNE